MNRQERRRQWRERKKWLAAVAADPSVDHEALLVAEWIANNADENGHVEFPDGKEVRVQWPN